MFNNKRIAALEAELLRANESFERHIGEINRAIELRLNESNCSDLFLVYGNASATQKAISINKVVQLILDHLGAKIIEEKARPAKLSLEISEKEK